MVLALYAFHGGEKQHIPYSRRIRQQHTHPVNAKPDASGGRHTDLQRVQEILVGGVGFLVSSE